MLRKVLLPGLRTVALHLAKIPTAALPSIGPWMRQTNNLPMDLAAASLLWLAHHRNIRAIATLDRRDFSVYRLPGGDALHNVMEAMQ